MDRRVLDRPGELVHLHRLLGPRVADERLRERDVADRRLRLRGGHRQRPAAPQLHQVGAVGGDREGRDDERQHGARVESCGAGDLRARRAHDGRQQAPARLGAGPTRCAEWAESTNHWTVLPTPCRALRAESVTTPEFGAVYFYAAPSSQLGSGLNWTPGCTRVARHLRAGEAASGGRGVGLPLVCPTFLCLHAHVQRTLTPSLDMNDATNDWTIRVPEKKSQSAQAYARASEMRVRPADVSSALHYSSCRVAARRGSRCA